MQNGGTHWGGIIQSYRFLYYFDSYGGSTLQEIVDLYKPEFKISFINYAVQMQNTAICWNLILIFFEYLLKFKPSSLYYYKLIEVLSKHSKREIIDEQK